MENVDPVILGMTLPELLSERQRIAARLAGDGATLYEAQRYRQICAALDELETARSKARRLAPPAQHKTPAIPKIDLSELDDSERRASYYPQPAQESDE